MLLHEVELLNSRHIPIDTSEVPARFGSDYLMQDAAD